VERRRILQRVILGGQGNVIKHGKVREERGDHKNKKRSKKEEVKEENRKGSVYCRGELGKGE
jgi:hypothetical protein